MDPVNVSAFFPNGLSMDAGMQVLGPVAVYVLGMVGYAVFVFKFYRFVASRDMFSLDLSRYEESRVGVARRLLRLVMYLVKYIVLFPAFAFFWFAVLTLILAFLSREKSFADILLISLATVSAIRVTAYYSEDLSRDLAKILPFAVLGIFLVDASFFDIDSSLAVLREANMHRDTIFYYWVFLVLVEFALRFIFGYVSILVFERSRRSSPQSSTPSPGPETEPAPADD